MAFPELALHRAIAKGAYAPIAGTQRRDIEAELRRIAAPRCEGARHGF